jgi:hypothetical protein
MTRRKASCCGVEGVVAVCGVGVDAVDDIGDRLEVGAVDGAGEVEEAAAGRGAE